MKRFVFRLETLLRYRESLENLREQSFRAAQSELQLIEARMDQITIEYRATIAGRPGSVVGERFDAPAIIDRERYVVVLQAALAEEEKRAEGSRILVEERRIALVQARQAREAVSKLRDKEFAEYTAQVARAEQAVLDEQATTRFIRRGQAY